MHTFPSGLHSGFHFGQKSELTWPSVSSCLVFSVSNIYSWWCSNSVINCQPSSPKGPVLSSAAMSAKAISEQTGKEFLYKYICTTAAVQNRFRYASVTAETDWDRLTQEHPWLLTEVRLLWHTQYNLKRLPLACLSFWLFLQLADEYWNHEANYIQQVTETLYTWFAGCYVITTVTCDCVIIVI